MDFIDDISDDDEPTSYRLGETAIQNPLRKQQQQIEHHTWCDHSTLQSCCNSIFVEIMKLKTHIKCNERWVGGSDVSGPAKAHTNATQEIAASLLYKHAAVVVITHLPVGYTTLLSSPVGNLCSKLKMAKFQRCDLLHIHDAPHVSPADSPYDHLATDQNQPMSAFLCNGQPLGRGNGHHISGHRRYDMVACFHVSCPQHRGTARRNSKLLWQILCPGGVLLFAPLSTPTASGSTAVQTAAGATAQSAIEMSATSLQPAADLDKDPTSSTITTTTPLSRKSDPSLSIATAACFDAGLLLRYWAVENAAVFSIPSQQQQQQVVRVCSRGVTVNPLGGHAYLADEAPAVTGRAGDSPDTTYVSNPVEAGAAFVGASAAATAAADAAATAAATAAVADTAVSVATTTAVAETASSEIRFSKHSIEPEQVILQEQEQEHRWLDAVTVTLSVEESRRGCASDSNRQKASDALLKHGVCVLPGLFDPETVLAWGAVSKTDMDSAMQKLRQGHNVEMWPDDLRPPHVRQQQQQKEQEPHANASVQSGANRTKGADAPRPAMKNVVDNNFHELSMREALRCDLRNTPNLKLLQNASCGQAAAVGQDAYHGQMSTTRRLTVEESFDKDGKDEVRDERKNEGKGDDHGREESQSNDGAPAVMRDFRNHPLITSLLTDVMNPVPTDPARQHDIQGNWGKWNFDGAGPGVPTAPRVGKMGVIMTLPGCADQTIHADTAHIFEHVHLPPHYVNLFIPASSPAPAHYNSTHYSLEGNIISCSNYGIPTGAEAATANNDDDDQDLSAYRVGQTAFVLGSHRMDICAAIMANPDYVAGQDEFRHRLIRPHLQPGDALLFDCRILHFGMGNSANASSANIQTQIQEKGNISTTAAINDTAVTHPSDTLAGPQQLDSLNKGSVADGINSGHAFYRCCDKCWEHRVRQQVQQHRLKPGAKVQSAAEAHEKGGHHSECERCWWRPMLYVNYHLPWFHDPKNWNDAAKLFTEKD